jgi:DNA-binding NarL/FixJ family response regulator
MTDGVASEISKKLDRLIRLTAISVLGDKPQRKQIELLGRSGLAAKDIATLVGTTANTVSVTLSQIKKNNGKVQKGKKK